MKASYLSFSLALLAVAAVGCDDISEQDRYIKVEKPTVENPRNLLIMEFTGNGCMNCPTGAAMLSDIKNDEEPGRVISVGLHPDGDINTTPVYSKYLKGMQNFRTPEATALYKYYEPSGFPSAIFNGLKSSMSGSISDWMQRASEALVVPAGMTVAASAEYDAESRKLTVGYDVEFGKKYDSQLNVTVWLVENHIMGTQTMPDGKKNLDYEHNHVLRASLNGDWGESLGSSFVVEEHKTGSASMTLSDKWVAENCEVVVFVYRDDSKEVEQSVSIPAVAAAEN